LHNSGTLTPSVLGTKATSTAINYETDQHILPAQVDVATASSNILLEAPPPLSPNVLTYALEDAITFSPGDTQQPVVLSSAQNAGALPQVFKSFATPIAPQPAQTLAKPAEIPAIVSETLTAATPEDNRVVVQLDPPELGRITIDFKFDGQALQAIAITSETPEALRQLRHMHFELIQALEDNGLSNGDLSFNQEKGSEHQARQFDQQHKAKTTIAAQPSQWSPKNQRTTNTDAGLDIKV
jgi:flagellar hook-length control protein FliK